MSDTREVKIENTFTFSGKPEHWRLAHKKLQAKAKQNDWMDALDKNKVTNIIGVTEDKTPKIKMKHRYNGEVHATKIEKAREVAFEELDDPEIFIIDSGASSHSTNNKTGAIAEKQCKTASIGHSGGAVAAESALKLKGTFVDKDGNQGVEAVLRDVKYSKDYNFNLLSMTKLTDDGWAIKGDANGFVATRNGQKIQFDLRVQTASGQIFACRFAREKEISVVNTERGTAMNIQRAHEMLGHHNEDMTRTMAKLLGWRITRGKMKPCEECAKAKAKQKNVKKKSTSPKSEKPGERIYLDVSKVSVRKKNGGEYNLQNKWWCIMVDEATGKKYATFTRTKKGIVEPVCEWMNRMKSRGIHIRRIRLDPGGENIKLEKRTASVDWQSLQPVDFEFTSRDTPQHNSLAEVAFPYLAGLARTMMGAANIPEVERGRIVEHALKHAIALDGLRPVTVAGKLATRDEHMYGNNSKWIKNMRRFGECGVVKEGKHGKAGSRGTTMMFVGYAGNRETDSYIMYNPDTRETVTTRDIIWMNRMMYKKPKDDITNDSDSVEEESESEEETLICKTTKRVRFVDEVERNENNYNAENSEDELLSDTEDEEESTVEEAVRNPRVRGSENNVPQEIRTTRSGRRVAARERLIEHMQINAETRGVTAADVHYLQRMMDTNEKEFDFMGVGAGVGGGFDNTAELHVLTYKQAMKSEDREEWKKEVKKEKERFDKNNVLTAKKRSEIPKGTKIITSTWAMKKKSSGKYRGRLNLRGFQQRDGEHYVSTSISSPVTNETSVRIAFVMLALCPGWIAVVEDVEGAFLQGEFTDGEVIYMEVPEGWEEYYDEDTVLLLNVPIYGTKQGAACFYKKLVETVQGKMYQRSQADPCLYYRWKNGRLVMMLSWIDDNLILGYPEDVEQFRKDLEAGFKCKYEGPLTEYVGSKIEMTRRESGTEIKITQPVLVQSLQDEFDLPEGKPPRTPATAGQVLVRNPDEPNLGKKESTKYRSGTAKMMFMMRWSQPDIYNAVRGLARHMAQPQARHYKAMQSCMKYVLSTRDRGLLIKPEGQWNGTKGFKFRIGGRSDSDYAANTEDRRSISGGRTFLNEAPVVFRSTTQRFVTLSVTEAETAAGVMVAQDMMYVYRLITSMGLDVELPMILEMDNKGAVDLANNWSVGGRTRHVDVRNFYLRELKDEGYLLIKHVPGDDNEADIFTKNTPYAILNKHIKKFVGEDEYTEQDNQTPE